jgi:hypothetical protein
MDVSFSSRRVDYYEFCKGVETPIDIIMNHSKESIRTGDGGCRGQMTGRIRFIGKVGNRLTSL